MQLQKHLGRSRRSAGQGRPRRSFRLLPDRCRQPLGEPRRRRQPGFVLADAARQRAVRLPRRAASAARGRMGRAGSRFAPHAARRAPCAGAGVAAAGVGLIGAGPAAACRRSIRVAARISRAQHAPRVAPVARAGAFATTAEHPADPRRRCAALLHFLSSLQEDLLSFVDRCPGRSLLAQAPGLRAHAACAPASGRQPRPTVTAVGTGAAVAISRSGISPRPSMRSTGRAARNDVAHPPAPGVRCCSKNTSLSVGEVGAACGFENPCSFARAFRAHYGTHRHRGYSRSAMRLPL